MLGVLQKQESEGEETLLACRERDTPAREGRAAPRPQSPRAGHCRAYSGGGRRLCSFLSSRPFQYLKLLSKCCIRLGRSAKAGETTKDVEAKCQIRLFVFNDGVVCFFSIDTDIFLIHCCIPKT